MPFVEEGYEEGEDDGAQNHLLHDDNDDSDYNSDDELDECFDVNVTAQFEEAHTDGNDTQGYYDELDDSTGDDRPLPMFASTVTMNGLRVTIASIIDIIEFVLRKYDPYKYVLTGKLNQDLIEVMMIVNK